MSLLLTTIHTGSESLLVCCTTSTQADRPFHCLKVAFQNCVNSRCPTVIRRQAYCLQWLRKVFRPSALLSEWWIVPKIVTLQTFSISKVLDSYSPQTKQLNFQTLNVQSHTDDEQQWTNAVLNQLPNLKDLAIGNIGSSINFSPSLTVLYTQKYRHSG